MRSRKEWRSAAAKTLTEQSGLQDPTVAVRLKSSDLVKMLTGPPFVLDCNAIREAVKISEIRYVPDSSTHGRIFWRGEGYVIEIKSTLPSSRRAFTLAHEIAHTFFLQPGDNRSAERTDQVSTRKFDDDKEESLCDIAAAELLMPAIAFVDHTRRVPLSDMALSINAFLGRVCEYGPSARSILSLAKEFGTSVSATAKRFAELSVWACHVGFWATENSALPRFEFGFLSKTSGLTLANGCEAPLNSIISHAANAEVSVRGWSEVGFISASGESLGKVFGQAIHLKGAKRVLSVTVFEKNPEYHCSMSERLQSDARRTANAQRTFRFASLAKKKSP